MQLLRKYLLQIEGIQYNYFKDPWENLTHFTDKGVESQAVVHLDGLVNEHGTLVDSVYLLYPHSIVEVVLLLLTPQEVEYLKVVSHHVRHRRIVRLKHCYSTINTSSQFNKVSLTVKIKKSIQSQTHFNFIIFYSIIFFLSEVTARI